MKTLVTVSVASLCFGLPTFAHAQQTQASGQEVSTIVVIGRNFVAEQSSAATKDNAPILETPQAISVVDSGFIDTLNLRTIAEALNYTSGVRSQAFGSDTRIEYYQLRGLPMGLRH